MNEQQLRRLSDCEVQVSKYHDKLEAYLKQCDVFSKSTVSLQEFQKQMEDYNGRISRDFGMVRKDIVALCQENHYLLNRFNVLEEESTIQMKNHLAAFEKQKCQVEQLKTDAENSYSNHMSHMQNISILKDRMADFEKNFSKLDILQSNLLKFIDDNQKKYALLEARIQDLTKTLADNKISEIALYQDVLTSMHEIKKCLEDKFSNLKNSFDGHRQDTSSLVNSLITQINERINNIPKPAIPEPQQIDITPQLESFKKSIDESYGAGLLDVANAKTKSDVNEMQLKIMDKKLENIYLLLKKHDLTQ